MKYHQFIKNLAKAMTNAADGTFYDETDRESFYSVFSDRTIDIESMAEAAFDFFKDNDIVNDKFWENNK